MDLCQVMELIIRQIYRIANVAQGRAHFIVKN